MYVQQFTIAPRHILVSTKSTVSTYVNIRVKKLYQTWRNNESQGMIPFSPLEWFGCPLMFDTWYKHVSYHETVLFNTSSSGVDGVWCLVEIEIPNEAVTFAVRNEGDVEVIEMYECLLQKLFRKGIYQTADTAYRPCVLVCGPSDSGKSSFCRFMMNSYWKYGKRYKHLSFVDVDVGQGSITVPGCIAMAEINGMMTPDKGMLCRNPQIYYYGHLHPNALPGMYLQYIEQLGIMAKNKEDAGMFINTGGMISGIGFQAIRKVIECFHITDVVVMKDEQLFEKLSQPNKLYSSKGHFVCHFLAGVDRSSYKSPNIRKQSRDLAIQRYFKGPQLKFTPYKLVVSKKRLKLFIPFDRTNQDCPNFHLPIGSQVGDSSILMHESWSIEHNNRIMAISNAKTPERILNSTVCGFVYIIKTPTKSDQTIELLSPYPKLPEHKFLLGGFVQI